MDRTIAAAPTAAVTANATAAAVGQEQKHKKITYKSLAQKLGFWGERFVCELCWIVQRKRKDKKQERAHPENKETYAF